MLGKRDGVEWDWVCGAGEGVGMGWGFGFENSGSVARGLRVEQDRDGEVGVVRLGWVLLG